MQPITKDPIATKLIHFLDQSSALTTPTPTSTCNARVCQMLRRHTHLRGAPSSHRRGVNLLKMVLPARGYGPPCCYEPLCCGPVVEPAGMTSSVPYHEPVFGPSRHSDASCTVATWLPRDRKPYQVADWGEGVGSRGGGGGSGMEDREWRENKFFEEDQGETKRMEKEGEGGGVDRGRRQDRFLIKVDHSQQPYTASKPHLSWNYDRLHTTKWED